MDTEIDAESVVESRTARVAPIGLRDIELTRDEEQFLSDMVEQSASTLALSPRTLPDVDAATLLRRRAIRRDP